MKAAIALLILLSLSACHEKAPGKGNEPTYSGNSAGNRNAQVLVACADAVLGILKDHPKADGDALFRSCYLKNGVQFI